MLILKNCRIALTPTSGGFSILSNVDIAVDEGLIAKVGEVKPSRGDEVVECGGLVTPGLFNAHTHLPMVVLRGFTDGKELQEWLGEIQPIEKLMPGWLIRSGLELGIIESIMNGTAAALDMYIYDYEDAVELASKYGIRLYTGPVFIDFFNDPKYVENRLRNIASMGVGGLVKPVINVHSVYAVGEDTLRRVSELRNELGLRIHIHVSETRRELYEVRAKYGAYPVEVLDKFGLLGPWTILVHLGWVTNWEVEAIARAGSTAVHCPTSNMWLATAGFFPVRELLNMGVNVALGTDGAASNGTLDMLREVKEAILLQRNNYWSPKALGPGEALAMATVNGYRAVGERGGAIAEGYLADLVVYDLEDPRVRPVNRRNIANIWAYSMDGSMVKMVMVNGRVVYDRSRDYERFVERARSIEEEVNGWLGKIAPL